jgi:hypothetical protein
MNAKAAVDLQDMPESGQPPISTIGLGLRWVSSLMRVHYPPANITVFIGERQKGLASVP